MSHPLPTSPLSPRALRPERLQPTTEEVTETVRDNQDRKHPGSWTLLTPMQATGTPDERPVHPLMPTAATLTIVQGASCNSRLGTIFCLIGLRFGHAVTTIA
jgi:hypothetical protein